MKANLDQITRALTAPSPDIRLYLLHGADESGSLALEKTLARACGADANRIDLDGPTLKADPARLADEAASFSLFGGKQYVRIHPATEEAVPAIEALLQAEQAENPVVAIAGALKPSSALLKLALADSRALAFASYAPEGIKADKIAETIGREMGLRLDADVARAIAVGASGDRAIMSQEIEKLALYLDAAPDRPASAGREALDAVSAAGAEGELSRLVEAVLEGQSVHAVVEMSRLAQDGLEGIPLLRSIAKRLQLLISLRAQMETGTSLDTAMASAGKSIFWKEEAGVRRQLSRWTAEKLAQAAERVLNVERAIKSAGAAGTILADHELLTISRVAARAR